MTIAETLIDSWNRQCNCINNLLSLMTFELLDSKPSADGWTLAFHFAHIHSTRRYWHMKAAGLESPVGPSLYTVANDDWIPSLDLTEIRARLAESQILVSTWVSEQVQSQNSSIEHYDHPILYLQHMIWHEGWHAGLIMLALRLAGQEPTEEWECANLWDLWRLPD